MNDTVTSKRWLLALVFMLTIIFLTLWPNQSGQAQGRMHRDQTDMWNPSWMHRDWWGSENGAMESDRRQRMRRHRSFMHSGVPQAYRGKSNPLAATEHNVKNGSSLYAKQCASCHGAQGMGGGDKSKNLNPSPALLAYMIQMPMSVDEYLMWSISEGGQEFETAMPAFKDTLSQKEIWQIAVFMRSGFPELESAQQESN